MSAARGRADQLRLDRGGGEQCPAQRPTVDHCHHVLPDPGQPLGRTAQPQRRSGQGGLGGVSGWSNARSARLSASTSAGVSSSRTTRVARQAGPGAASAATGPASTISSSGRSGGARAVGDRPTGREQRDRAARRADPPDERLPGARPGGLHHHPGAECQRAQHHQLRCRAPRRPAAPGCSPAGTVARSRLRRGGWRPPSCPPRPLTAPVVDRRALSRSGRRWAPPRPGCRQRQRQRGGQPAQVGAVESCAAFRPVGHQAASASLAAASSAAVPVASRTVSSVGTPLAAGGPARRRAATDAERDTVVAVAGRASSRGTSRRPPQRPRPASGAGGRWPGQSAGPDHRPGLPDRFAVVVGQLAQDAQRGRRAEWPRGQRPEPADDPPDRAGERPAQVLLGPTVHPQHPDRQHRPLAPGEPPVGELPVRRRRPCHRRSAPAPAHRRAAVGPAPGAGPARPGGATSAGAGIAWDTSPSRSPGSPSSRSATMPGGVLQHGRRPAGQLGRADDGARGDQVEQCRPRRPARSTPRRRVRCPVADAQPLEQPPPPHRHPGGGHQQRGHQRGRRDDRCVSAEGDEHERRRDLHGDQLAGSRSGSRTTAECDPVGHRRPATGGALTDRPRAPSVGRPGPPTRGEAPASDPIGVGGCGPPVVIAGTVPPPPVGTGSGGRRPPAARHAPRRGCGTS